MTPRGKPPSQTWRTFLENHLNPYVERVVGSVRRECLNHIIAINEASLRETLRSYFSVSVFNKALELDPLSPVLHVQLGSRYLDLHHYDRAKKQFNNALELDPHSFAAHFGLGFTYIATEQFEKAVQANETAIKFFGRVPMLLAIQGLIYTRMGRIEKAQQLLEELNGLMQKEYVPSTAIAWIYFGLGEIDKAFDWFEKGIEERHFMIIFALHLPVFDPLRPHPRYKALLRKMYLEP